MSARSWALCLETLKEAHLYKNLFLLTLQEYVYINTDHDKEKTFGLVNLLTKDNAYIHARKLIPN